MGIKLDFGSKAPEMSEGNQDEVAKMKECIAMIESGEGEKAIPILQSLIGGEAEEDEVEDAPEKPNFREAMANKI